MQTRILGKANSLNAFDKRIVAEKFGADKLRTRESCDEVTAAEYDSYTHAEPASELALPCSAKTSKPARKSSNDTDRLRAAIMERYRTHTI